jgi:hypothetical protein
VLFQPLAEGGVLLDTRSETYFGLNAAGARVCELLRDTRASIALCAELGREYADVPAETLRMDVMALLDELLALVLLEVPGPMRTAAPCGAPNCVGSRGSRPPSCCCCMRSGWCVARSCACGARRAAAWYPVTTWSSCC